jgi:hypothetical protein
MSHANSQTNEYSSQEISLSSFIRLATLAEVDTEQSVIIVVGRINSNILTRHRGIIDLGASKSAS